MNRRRLITNTLANWTGLGFATLASLVLTPYLIHHLEAERFGIYQISRQFVLYLVLFDLGIQGSVMRFASQAIAQGDHRRVDALTNGALALCLGIAAVGFVISALVALAAPGFFRVDPAHVDDTRALFVGLGAWWMLTMLTIPARGILIGHQRYGLLSLVTACSWILTVAGIVGLFELGHVALGTVALAFVFGGVVHLLGYVVIAGWLQPSLRWSWRHVDRATIRTLYGFGLWSMLFTVAGLFLWSSDSIVIGRMLGLEAVPAYAIPFMLIHYGRIIGFGFATQMTPIAAAQAAAGDTAGLRRTLLQSTRIGLILTLAGNGVLIVLAGDLLRLWVGPDHAGGGLVYAYLMLSFWAVYAHLPIYFLLMGAGDIRPPAVVALTASAVTLLLKILVLAWGLGIEAVALANCVLVLPAMLIFIPWHACRLAELPLWQLYRRAYAGPILAFLPVLGGSWLVSQALSPMGLLEFGLCFGLLMLAYLLIVLATSSASDRAAALRLLRLPQGGPGATGGPPRPGKGMTRLLWMTWEDHRRSRSLAARLNAELHELSVTLGRPRLVRYLVNLRDTIRIYRQRRPATVICQHPSFLLAVLTLLLRPVLGYRVGLDAHNGGLAIDPWSTPLQRRLARWLQRRADFVIVHNDEVARLVASRGGTLVTLPDPLPTIRRGPPLALARPFNLLFVCSFMPDEPYGAVLEAARRIDPDIGIYVTGNPRGRVDTTAWPEHVVFCGRVSWERYDQLLSSVDGVIDLSTRERCLVCGAYEAVAAGKPMILSRTATLMGYFTRGALFTDNQVGDSPHSIRWAILELRRRRTELEAEVAVLKAELSESWERRQERLLALL